MKKITRKIVGVVFIVLGLLALFTPFTPGSWLIPLGLELLGLRILLQDRLLAWARARPNSKPVRIICRIMCIWERDPAAKRKWRRLWKGRRQSPSSSTSCSKSRKL
jgi:hypothetical protein